MNQTAAIVKNPRPLSIPGTYRGGGEAVVAETEVGPAFGCPGPGDLARPQSPPSVRQGRATDTQAPLLALGPAGPGLRAGWARLGPTGLAPGLGPALASCREDKEEPKSKGRRADKCAFRGTALEGAPGRRLLPTGRPPSRGGRADGGRFRSLPPGRRVESARGELLARPGEGQRTATGDRPGTPTPRTRHPPRGQGKPRPVDLVRPAKML
ncbi:translation initiation factor IF-2-like [Sturnira hondurensis]|uniref:translation initiation factor IF-2-like n=1 Tax=Sturnira hondurensis TaxID=192404 RepID=UPI00187A2436|nr:translation initiation factor IF-2-like [Sturnira hondurensis]